MQNLQFCLLQRHGIQAYSKRCCVWLQLAHIGACRSWYNAKKTPDLFRLQNELLVCKGPWWSMMVIQKCYWCQCVSVTFLHCQHAESTWSVICMVLPFVWNGVKAWNLNTGVVLSLWGDDYTHFDVCIFNVVRSAKVTFLPDPGATVASIVLQQRHSSSFVTWISQSFAMTLSQLWSPCC